MPGLSVSKSDEKMTMSEKDEKFMVEMSDDSDGDEYDYDGRCNIKPYDYNDPNSRGKKVVILEDPEVIKCTTCSMEDDHYAEGCPNIKADGTIDYNYKEKLVCLLCGKKGEHNSWCCPNMLPEPCEYCGVMEDDSNHDYMACVFKRAAEEKPFYQRGIKIELKI